MRYQSYHNFWQRIHQSAKEKGFPVRVMFELTYRCNFYCRHCYVPFSYRRKKELKTEEVFSLLNQLKDIGCFYLGFTGGEPFMRKDIMEILWYAKKKGFEIIIYTNGSLIDERIAQELKDIRPNKVDITIPAMSKGAFERITQISGSQRKVFNAIDLLRKRGVNLGFKSCVLKESESEIKDIQDFVSSLNAQHRLDNTLSPRLDGSREPYKYRGIMRKNSITRNTSHVAGNTYHVAREASQVTPDTCYVVPDTKDLFRCGVGLSQAAITPLGELKMCVMIDYPKYKILCNDHRTYHVSRNTSHVARQISKVRCQERGLEEAWNSLKELVVSIKPDENYQCDKCEVYTFCKWCAGKAYLYNKSFTTCEPESRRKAELVKQTLMNV